MRLNVDALSFLLYLPFIFSLSADTKLGSKEKLARTRSTNGDAGIEALGSSSITILKVQSYYVGCMAERKVEGN